MASRDAPSPGLVPGTRSIRSTRQSQSSRPPLHGPATKRKSATAGTIQRGWRVRPHRTERLHRSALEEGRHQSTKLWPDTEAALRARAQNSRVVGRMIAMRCSSPRGLLARRWFRRRSFAPWTRGHCEKRSAAAAFSPNGRLVATSSLDGTARVWSIEDGSIVATLRHIQELAGARRTTPVGPRRPDHRPPRWQAWHSPQVVKRCSCSLIAAATFFFFFFWCGARSSTCWRSGVPSPLPIRPIHDILPELQWQEERRDAPHPRRVRTADHGQPAARRQSGRARLRGRQTGQPCCRRPRV